MNVLRSVLLIAALVPCVYYVLATYCAWDYFRKARKILLPDVSFTPPASILKPVRGLDREAYENFASFCCLDYPNYEILVAVGDHEDPMIPIIEKVQLDFPEREIRMLIGAPWVGANNKVNKLCLLAREAKHDLLVISDSDTRVEPDYLREMAAPFVKSDVGVVTALFRGKSGGGFFSELNALGVPAESMPSALVSRKLEGGMKFAFGWSMATTKKHLEEIGGFESIADYHSDDFELGNRIAAKGHRVEFMRKWIWMVFPNESLREFLVHELRWSIGLRNVRKLGYIGLAFTFGLPWAILGAMIAPSLGISAAYILAYFIFRMMMGWTAGVWGIGDPITRRSMWLVPVRDLVNFGVWVAGFFSSTIWWRGLEFHVRKGLLVPISEATNVRTIPAPEYSVVLNKRQRAENIP